jgi:hypothetical protein
MTSAEAEKWEAVFVEATAPPDEIHTVGPPVVIGTSQNDVLDKLDRYLKENGDTIGYPRPRILFYRNGVKTNPTFMA